MTIGSGAIEKALLARWTAKALDAQFTAYRQEGATDKVLHEGPVAISAPAFPYCVWEADEPRLVGRDSLGGGLNWHTWAFNFQMTIHAQQSATQDAKAIAYALALLVMAAYEDGTRLTVSETDGANVSIERATDFGVRDGDSEYLWSIRYAIQYETKQTITPY